METDSPKYWRRISWIAVLIGVLGGLLIVTGRNSRPDATSPSGLSNSCIVDGQPAPCPTSSGQNQTNDSEIKLHVADLETYFGSLILLFGSGMSLYSTLVLKQLRNKIFDYQYAQMTQIPPNLQRNRAGQIFSRNRCPKCGHGNLSLAGTCAACGHSLAQL